VNPARSRHCIRSFQVESQTLFVIDVKLKRDAQSQEDDMTYPTFAPTRPATVIPLHEWGSWAIFAGLILLLAIYFVGAEQGATSLISGKYVHEFVHDGRHLLGFPCH
jgi:hypothetical protein